jgi:hypothetical protein
VLITMTEDWRKSKGTELCQLVDDDLLARQDWENQRVEARAMYYGDIPRKDITWPGDDASDIHLPVIFENVERLVPKLNNAIWNVDPHVLVERTPDDYDPEETRIQEQFINWALENDIPNFYVTTHSWFRNMLLDGVGITKSRWRTVWRHTAETHRIKISFQPGEFTPMGFQVEEPKEKSAADILDEMFGRGKYVVHQDNGAELRLTIEEDRRIIENVRVLFTDASQFVDEVEIVVHRPVLVQDSPEVDVVEAEHFIVPYRTKDIPSARRATQEHYMTMAEVRAEASPKKYDPWVLSEDDAARLSAYAESMTEDQQPNYNNRELAKLKDDVEGVRPSVYHGSDNNQLLFYEIYLREDIDGDGLQEDLVLQVSPILKKVMHVTFQDMIHPHGRRPFASIHFLSPSDRFYCPGLAQFLAPLNIQANITINQVNDRQTIINNPIGFFRPMALPQDPEGYERLRPGDMVPTPDPGGVVFPDWGKAPLQDLTLMNEMLAFADRLGTSPMTGGSSNFPNAPRTARGTLALLSEGNLKIDVLISMAQKEGFAELLNQLFGLYHTFMPDEKYFWVTGHGRKRIPEAASRKMMRGRFIFTFTGNTVNTNPEVQRTLAQMRYQVASTNPLYMQDPVKFRELLRDFLAAHSDGTSVERILPDLPGGGAESHPPMPQSHENMAMREHRPVDVLSSDNDMQHMLEIRALWQSPEFHYWDDIGIALLAQHYNAHNQQSARKQQMAALAQQSGGGGEQNVGLSGMEGGVQ